MNKTKTKLIPNILEQYFGNTKDHERVHKETLEYVRKWKLNKQKNERTK
tara:strand:- start:112 stop:258 length:147 start_codon:yes stop_codon:yes gene_type:complete